MRITRTNKQVLVTEDIFGELAQLHRTFVFESRVGDRIEATPLGRFVNQGIWEAPAGLFPRIAAYANHEGIPFQIEDLRHGRDGDLERPDWNILYPVVAQRTITAIAQNENGILVFPTGAGKARVIATLLDYIGPHAHGIVIGGATTETEQLFDTLKKWLPFHKLSVRTGTRKTPPARVIVTTIESALKLPEEMANAQFFIGDEVHRNGRPTGLQLLGMLSDTCAYKFGLTATPERYDNAEAWVLAELGPILAEIPYQEAESENIVAPMEVWVYPTPTAGELSWTGWSVPTGEMPFQILEMKGIYKNAFLAAFISDIVANEIPAEMSTLLCIEKTYQGYLLNHFLKVRHGLEIPMLHRGLPRGRFEALKNGFKKQNPLKLIATKVLNCGFDYPQLECVVNGVGMLRAIDSIQRSGRAARIAAGKENGLLIEIEHNYHSQLRMLSEKRFELYRQKGWAIIRKQIPCPKYRKEEQPKPSSLDSELAA